MMSLPEAADWSRRDFDVTSIGSSAADWSRNYVGYLGCFNVNDRMPKISVPVVGVAIILHEIVMIQY